MDAANVTGNIADLTKLYITNADNFASLGGETVTISGTVTAAQADSIADKTTAAVTANIAAATAASLNAALSDGAAVNAYKLTVNGATAAAADLISLNAKTAEKITVDAKEITGTIAQLGAAGTGLYVAGKSCDKRYTAMFPVADCNRPDRSGAEQLSVCTGMCEGRRTICTACIFRRNPWTICGNRRVVRAEYRAGRRKKIYTGTGADACRGNRGRRDSISKGKRRGTSGEVRYQT